MERDNFMNPDESLKYGLIDKIIDKRSRITITQAMRRITSMSTKDIIPITGLR